MYSSIVNFVGIVYYIYQVRKGDTIGEFLRAVQQQLAPEFREVRTASVENMLYVKEDLIIPHVRPDHLAHSHSSQPTIQL